MKIPSTTQLKDWDTYTIEHEPIRSIDLMERASQAFVDTFTDEVSKSTKVFVLAGPGNNGGDALAIARMLLDDGYTVETFLFNKHDQLSPDCQTNKDRLLALPEAVLHEIKDSFFPPTISRNQVIIDGLFGSGLNKPLSGGYTTLVKFFNHTRADIYSIDIPSGLFGEDNTYNPADAIIKAKRTFTFQSPKLSFLLADSAAYVGKWEVLDIGLHPEGLQLIDTPYNYTLPNDISPLLLHRGTFSHKGTFGHALLMVGSKGKMGAAVLSAQACLRSGCGLLTVALPGCGETIMQTSLPEAMVISDEEDEVLSRTPDLTAFSAIGLGPGIGQLAPTVRMIGELLDSWRSPMVIDADALNIIATDRSLLRRVPKQSILTPHPRELDRLTGTSHSSYERLMKARELATSIESIVVLKGAYTAICLPDGRVHFNTTGNPGMATAGSGDVLTGILTGLLAQAYSPRDAALLGVYLHGLAGDIAATRQSSESLIASDITKHLGRAFRYLQQL